jgi:hypothetical protein
LFEPLEDVVAFGGTPAPCALGCAANGAGAGKNVAFCPLKICHWSQSNTMEKPKITHKMVRRMSFMCFSFQMWMAVNWQKSRVKERDHARPHTKDGIALIAAT